jgi:aspartate/glutamate racemase
MQKRNVAKLKIGIMGGSGALASAVFLLNFTRACARAAKTKADGDYPDILYLSSAFGFFTEKGIVDEMSVKKQLEDKIDFFARNGADVLFIPCVSLMGVADGSKSGNMKLVNLVNETNEYLASDEFTKKNVLVLSSDFTRGKKLFKSSNCNLVYLNSKEQRSIDTLILAAIAGKFEPALSAYERILKRRDPDFILLGCTELPLVLPCGHPKYIDPLKISLNRYFMQNN